MTDVQESRSAWTRAQAKLNLRLHVLAREAGGYHSIETIFHRVEFGDDVRLTLAPEGTRTVLTTVDVGPPEENLAFRAATLYCEMREWTTGFHIEIGKRIPAGGGMGGGSADAAATLRLLDALAPYDDDEDEDEIGERNDITLLARELGADVPFLTTGAVMSLAWGHGDRMLLLPPLPQRHVALLFPGFSVSTADAYAAVGATLAHGHPLPFTSAMGIPAEELRSWTRYVAEPPGDWMLANDFAVAVPDNARGEISNAMHALEEAGAQHGGMTGSGSTLFGIFDAEPDAEALERATGYQVVLTRTADAVEPVHLND